MEVEKTRHNHRLYSVSLFSFPSFSAVSTFLYGWCWRRSKALTPSQPTNYERREANHAHTNAQSYSRTHTCPHWHCFSSIHSKATNCCFVAVWMNVLDDDDDCVYVPCGPVYVCYLFVNVSLSFIHPLSGCVRLCLCAYVFGLLLLCFGSSEYRTDRTNEQHNKTHFSLDSLSWNIERCKHQPNQPLLLSKIYNKI